MSDALPLFRTTIALSIALAAVGCKDRRDTGAAPPPPDSAMMSPANDTMATVAPATSGAAGGLSDANLVFLLDEANMADSASAAYAVGKATNPEVKAFAGS